MRTARNRNSDAEATVLRKSDASRSQILQAAARLFRDQGYAATTLRQIAEAADMQAGSIYYHFASKDDLLHEILDTGLRRIFDAVRTAIAQMPPGASHRRRIERAIDAHLVTLLKESEFTSANIRVYGQLPEEAKCRHRRLRQDYARFWDELFSEAQAAGEIRDDLQIRPLRMFVLGALNWTVEWFDNRRHSVRELANRTSLLIFQGIDKRRPDI